MNTSSSKIPVFDRRSYGTGERFTRIGHGELGGKARGLAFIKDFLATELDAARCPGIEVGIPTSTVVTTQMFDLFMERNSLHEIALSDRPDDRIAHAFQKADIPIEMVGDLKALINVVHTPLAVRSSGLLEDALYQPFAGVYATKMIPNNQHDPDERFRRLVEAIKFVWASAFFKSAKSYIRATDHEVNAEKMAVILQEVVGKRHGDRFYPDISGVARTYNFYPVGRARPEEGVVNLALGLGKTIVDGGITWTYSPAHPAVPPPYGSVRDLLKFSQLEFWAVNMGRSPRYDPIAETEYLLQADLQQAEYDGTLKQAASTYIASSDRLRTGIGSPGPRVLNFAPLLSFGDIPFNDLVRQLLSLCSDRVGGEVEIEFALTLDEANKASFGFLQVRPMVVSNELVVIEKEELERPGLLATSQWVMGNGSVEDIRDIVYVKPDVFEARDTRKIAAEIDRINRSLIDEGRHCLLIGFGRWGSADSWLGIPVDWDQISSAKVIIEATLPEMNVEPSQGSHFFHNMTSFKVSYLSVPHDGRPGIDWDWLQAQEVAGETDHVRHVRLNQPLLVKVDGRNGQAGIWRGE
jgi:hypothetical protein